MNVEVPAKSIEIEELLLLLRGSGYRFVAHFLGDFLSLSHRFLCDFLSPAFSTTTCTGQGSGDGLGA